MGVASGTDALHLALIACGVGPGDEVLTVSNTCAPTVAAIASVGAIPVFVDIDPVTYTMDPTLLESRMTARTKAILPVHLYGQCAQMAPILDIAKRFRLRVIEDCAQAHGGRYEGRVAGTMGDVGCYSFYPTKNLGALGDGGMVVTNDPEIANRVKLLRNGGQNQEGLSLFKIRHSRLDELQAAILSLKLTSLDAWNVRRRQIARLYSEGLSETEVLCPSEAPGRFHVYHLYVVRVKDRQRFRARMARRGIETLIHYPLPLHQQQAYSEYASGNSPLPTTDRVTSEIVSLPLYPELDDDEVAAILSAVKDAAAS